MDLTRRQLLQSAGAGALALALPAVAARAEEKKKAGFTLPPLPYAYDALEPHIDAETMMIHHDRHHKAYVDNLNKAIAADRPQLAGKSIEAILAMGPGKLTPLIVNNGGGHANHTLFWQVMGPNGGGQPDGELATAIGTAFGSFDSFKGKLTQSATTRFGSGWGWLVLTKGKLEVINTANQNSPLMKGQTPLLGIDVWEHAYYLKYKNLRPKYVEAWWNTVNWKNVAERYAMASKE
jgi:Fe-Mn family superoxide dismutase